MLHTLDTHGLAISDDGKGHRSPEAKIVRGLFKSWVKTQGIRPGLRYVMPLRVLSTLISTHHPHLLHHPTGGTNWSVVVDAVNDPHSGLTIVRQRYA